MNRIVAGVDLGGTKCLGVLAGLDGQPFTRHRIVLAEVGGAEAALSTMCAWLADHAQRSGQELVGAGIGVPAVIDPDSGRAVRGPNTGWDGFAVRSLVTALSCPVALDNDVNLAAYGEHAVGAARGHRDFAVVAVGTGLGGAVVSGGRLVRGASFAAGEFALLPVPASALVAGDLESVVSGVGIARAAAAYLADHPEAVATLGTAPDARRVFAAALAGDPHGEAVMAPVLEGVAICIVALAAVADPDLVVFDGSVGGALAPFLSRIEALLGDRLTTVPTLTCSALRPTATVVGAVQQALALAPGSASNHSKENTHVEG
ncbi:MAG: ROK family protein [Propioniciclava sp.]